MGTFEISLIVVGGGLALIFIGLMAWIPTASNGPCQACGVIWFSHAGSQKGDPHRYQKQLSNTW